MYKIILNSLGRPTHKSYVEFHQVIDAVADSKDTMMSVIDVLRTRKIIEGDAKIYDVLKSEYGDDLSWLIPYPGTCWWITSKYPLIKAYFDAGLNLNH